MRIEQGEVRCVLAGKGSGGGSGPGGKTIQGINLIEDTWAINKRVFLVGDTPTDYMDQNIKFKVDFSDGTSIEVDKNQVNAAAVQAEQTSIEFSYPKYPQEEQQPVTAVVGQVTVLQQPIIRFNTYPKQSYNTGDTFDVTGLDLSFSSKKIGNIELTLDVDSYTFKDGNTTLIPGESRFDSAATKTITVHGQYWIVDFSNGLWQILRTVDFSISYDIIIEAYDFDWDTATWDDIINLSKINPETIAQYIDLTNDQQEYEKDLPNGLGKAYVLGINLDTDCSITFGCVLNDYTYTFNKNNNLPSQLETQGGSSYVNSPNQMIERRLGTNLTQGIVPLKKATSMNNYTVIHSWGDLNRDSTDCVSLSPIKIWKISAFELGINYPGTYSSYCTDTTYKTFVPPNNYITKFSQPYPRSEKFKTLLWQSNRQEIVLRTCIPANAQKNGQVRLCEYRYNSGSPTFKTVQTSQYYWDDEHELAMIPCFTLGKAD